MSTEMIQDQPPRSSTLERPAFDFSPWTRLANQAPPPRPAQEPGSPFRFVERAVALLLLLFVLPFLILVAIAIVIDSPGAPVLYKQARVGLDRRRKRGDSGALTADPPPGNPERRQRLGEDRTFMIWKFRTMVPNAEAKTGPVWASEDDPRITRVGRVLRHLRVDEIPQLINVVFGSMRLIGPRPERPEFVRKLAQDVPEYRRRLLIAPGITGLAQVEREYDGDVNDVRTKLRYDLFYLENRYWLLDVKILLKTIDVVLRGRGAR